MDEWVSGSKINEILLSIPSKTAFSGDIYARFIN